MDRALYIDGQLADIDEQTAVGITLQSFDFTAPAKPKLAVSNAVSLPATARNRALFGYAGMPGFMGTAAYTKHSASYFVNGVEFMRGATARVDSVGGGRISIGLTQRPDLWDALKAISWADLITGYYYWLETQGLMYTASAPFVGIGNSGPQVVMLNFIATLSTSGPVQMGYSLRNLSADTDVNEGENKLYLVWQNENGTWRNGCHLNTPVRWLVLYLETVTGWTLTGNVSGSVPSVFDDPVAQGIVVPVPDWVVRTNYYARTWWVELADNVTTPSPHNDAKRDATAYDVLVGFMQLLNVVPEDQSTPALKYMAFARLDAIAETVDFSANIESVESFTPYVNGTAQKNYIGFESVYDGVQARAGAKLIGCDNENLPFDKDLLKIQGRVPSVRLGSDGVYFLRMAEANDLSKVTYLKDAGAFKTTNVYISAWEIGVRVEHTTALPTVHRVWAVYSPADEYNTYAAMLAKPEVWSIRKWMSPNDLNKFSFLKAYSVPRLGGRFFVNKIDGYNPASKEPCTVELVKIDNKVALPVVGAPWLDNAGVEWYDSSGHVWA